MRIADMELRFAGFPMTIRPSVLLLIAAIGWSVAVAGHPLWLFVCYAATLLVSVLVHELGHAFVLRFIGVRVQTITLHGLGGQVEWDGTERPLTNGEQLIVALAGPLSGLLSGVIAAVAIPFAADVFVLAVLGQFITTSILMNLANLLPALPLDGGWALLAVLNMATPRGWHLGAYVVVYLGSIIGTLLVVAGYHLGNVLVVIVGGQILLTNVLGTERLLSGSK